MVPLFVRFTLWVTFQVPLEIVIVPLLVEVPPRAVVGLAPKGTVQPEEITMSPELSLVIVTRLKVEAPQVTVESSVLALSANNTVPLLWLKVPAVRVKFLSTDKVADVEVTVPPVCVKDPSVTVILLLPPTKVPEATAKLDEPIASVKPLDCVTTLA